MKKRFWQSDGLYGLLIAIAFVLIAPSKFIQSLEIAAYDLGVSLSQRDAGDDVTVIAIDDDSIENIGRWPWSRTVLAEMIKKLDAAGAKVIANTILLSEPQSSPISRYVNDAIDTLENANYQVSNAPEVVEAVGLLKQGKTDVLENDQKLASSIAEAENVVLGMQFGLGAPLGKPDKATPEYVLNSRLESVTGSTEDGRPVFANSITPPIAIVGDKARAMGHISFPVDIDGGVRKDLLAIDYYNDYFPSIALMIAARSLNLEPDDVLIKQGKSVSLSNLVINTDANTAMYPFFYRGSDGGSAFTVRSFYDVQEDKIAPEVFKDKIVIIGATAYGVGNSLKTPTDATMAPALVLANVVASILNQDFFVVPDWALIAQILAFLLVALFIIMVLPKLTAKMAAISSALILLVLLGSSQFLLTQQAMWVKLMLPALLLATGYLFLITKRYLVTERGKLQADKASADSNRTLGLAMQQQGQLDMALDKFKACPLEDSMMEPLYSLALDFESKRQFNKAMGVYEYMATYDAKYKDIQEKIERNKALQDTVILGGSASGGAGTLMLDGTGMQKPKLGRYEVEKELGKGAMGVVYLGRDPKINRVVAIKTMALSQEFEEDELDQVKERFFREAETAGRLAHNNIVTIYDAGEEHDLAYIAMEFLEGHDLTRYTKKDALLPVKTVLKIIAACADALTYAHAENVVHRDIKPANVMFEPESKKLKITDFGIARITDSSKTKTGMILGTPSYMSPEQLSGKKVDGRSDLFSLGVMLYQMLSGQLPFKGDSMATLMFKIANEAHPEITEFNPNLAKLPCIATIVNKALAKAQEERYQTGAEMSMDIRNCLNSYGK